MLENFKVKTESEYNALSAEEKGEYNAMLKMYKAKQEEDRAAKQKEEVKAELKAELATEIAKAKEEAKAEAKVEAEAQIKVVKDEYDRKIEDAEKAMKNAKGNDPMRQGYASLEKSIVEQFEKSENKAQLIKDLINGKAEIETGSKDIAKVISKPAGSTAPEFVDSVWFGHDTMYGRQLVVNRPTNRDTIKFNQYSIDDTKDGIGGVTEGNEKPEFGFIATPKSEAIIKIAGWVDYTEEMADDVEGFASEIAREAVLAYQDVFDYQFFKGNGNQTTQLHGLWYDAPTQTLPMGNVNSGNNTIDKMVAGLTQIRKNHRGATAFVVAPEVWQDIYINKDLQEAYTYPILLNAQGVLTIGGVPVYWNNVFTGAEGIVGDFGRGAQVYTKKGLVLKRSDENKDNFIKNVTTLLVEAREAVVKKYAAGS